ncbi:MAG: hypothetical protein OSB57_12935 [Planctomycetota bacterium]|nr:hypothetical protein [Planctomycetota bacterium]
MSKTSSDDCGSYQTPNKHQIPSTHVAASKVGVAHTERISKFVEVTGVMPASFTGVLPTDILEALGRMDDTVDWRAFLEACR